MELIKVKSSNIEAIGYKEDKKLLRIKFTHGGIYDYKDVPEEVWEEFLKVESKGSFFYRKIWKKFQTAKQK